MLIVIGSNSNIRVSIISNSVSIQRRVDVDNITNIIYNTSIAINIAIRQRGQRVLNLWGSGGTNIIDNM